MACLHAGALRYLWCARRSSSVSSLAMTPGDSSPASWSASALPRAGDVVSGKYRIEKLLAEGGMGVVYLATHLQLDEKVAIKFLRTEFTGPQGGELAGRFLREARASAKIKSEHVVRVHDVGSIDTGAPYIVMEFLTGKDLDQIVSQHGFLPIPQAIDYVLQACEALAEAHHIGIVHRDLKPANLFLMHRADGSPCVKVLDFGISKFKDATSNTPDMGMTKTHAVMGSPRYMSPEQMRSSRDVDARADIWAIGIILYELLAGTVPFNGESMPQICAAILEETPKKLRTLRPELTAELDAIVSKCLAKKPDDRFANVAHLARALAAFGTPDARASAERIARVLRVSGHDVNADASLRDFTIPFSMTPSIPSAPQSSPSSPGHGADARSVSGASATSVAWTGVDTGSPQTKRRRRAIVAVGALTGIVGISVGVMFAHGHSAGTSAPAMHAESQAAQTQASPPPVVPDSTSSAVTTTASASATPTATSAPAQTASSNATAATTVVAKPPTPSKHAAPPRASPQGHANPQTTQTNQPSDMWGERK